MGGVLLAFLLLLGGPARADFLPPPAPADIDPVVQQVLDCWSYGHKLSSHATSAGVGGDGLVCLHGEGKPAVLATAQRLITTSKAHTLVVWLRAAGDTAAGAALAGQILDHHLTVVVDGPCVGPCLWWFLAGAKRLLTPDARLDFATFTPPPPALAERLRREAGVDLDRLARGGATLPTHDAVPTPAEMAAVGVPTLLTPPVIQPKAPTQHRRKSSGP